MLGVAKWFEAFGFDANETTVGDNGSLKPGMTTAIPRKAHLSFYLDGNWRPFDIVKARERREQGRSFNEPAETIDRQSGATFGAFEFSRGQFVTACLF